jgi:carboxypeptidase family protein
VNVLRICARFTSKPACFRSYGYSGIAAPSVPRYFYPPAVETATTRKRHMSGGFSGAEMTKKMRVGIAGSVLGLLTLTAASVSAQETAIAGLVRDTSGAVLPGVTVEVSSPALIEKTRAAVSDGAGRYKIGDLVPGQYAITFSLPGFTTVKREGIVLTDGFTAPVNADLKVGSIEETITVTTASPVVDVQSSNNFRTVITADTMSAIPAGSRNIQALGILIPGTGLQAGGGAAISRDVAGSGALQQSPLTFHGSTNTVIAVDGFRTSDTNGTGQYANPFNDGSFQEVGYSTGADSAEMAQGGLRINQVPKEGGNGFKGQFLINGTGSAWQWDNLNDDLRGRGITNVVKNERTHLYNPTFGGPLKQDRLWFFTSVMHQRVDKTVVDSYYDGDPDPVKYSPDLTRPAVDDHWSANASLRMTGQLNRKTKISGYFDRQWRVRPHWGATATNPPEAAGIFKLRRAIILTGKIQSTLTNKLLFEAGAEAYPVDWDELYEPAVTPTTYRIVDQRSGRACCAFTGQVLHRENIPGYSARLAYVTGSQNLTAGWTMRQGSQRTITTRTGNLAMQFGATAVNADASGFGPNQVTLQLPTDRLLGWKADSGLWANDKWTFNRATVTAGLRFDWFIGYVGTSKILTNPWVSATTFSEIHDTPNWKDVSPRLGVAYDLFGNNKTALRASVARYMDDQTVGFATTAGPLGRITSSQVLVWTDNNRDNSIFNADGSVEDVDFNPNAPIDPTTGLRQNELAPVPGSSTFGTQVFSTRIDPNIGSGFGKRGYSWEINAGAQHELTSGVSASATYFRRLLGGNALFTQNLNAGPTTFQGPYCITGPTDPRLPGGGGAQYCGLYQSTQASLSVAPDNYQTLLSNYLDPLHQAVTNYRHGVDVSMTARMHGWMMQGGSSWARTVNNTCYTALLGNPQIITSPINGRQNCFSVPPFQPDIKFLGSRELPLQIRVAATFQHTPGPQKLATWTFNQAIANANGFSITTAPGATAAQVAAATASIDLLGGTQIYDKALNQLDIRTAKRFSFGKTRRLEIQADLYNVTNSNWVFTENTTFGTNFTVAPTWLRPTNVLGARQFKLGAQLDF